MDFNFTFNFWSTKFTFEGWLSNVMFLEQKVLEIINRYSKKPIRGSWRDTC